MPISQYTISQFIVDAFTDTVLQEIRLLFVFWTNGCRIIPYRILPKKTNLSETAFTVKRNGYYVLRWFTPGGEIDLCGHATLATAFVLFQFIEVDVDSLTFATQSGELW